MFIKLRISNLIPMKTKFLLLIIGGFLLPSFLFGQFNYSVGIGFNNNHGVPTESGVQSVWSKYSYSFGGGINYKYQKFRFGFDLTLNRINWNFTPVGINIGLGSGNNPINLRTDYLISNPKIDFRISKNLYFGVGGLFMLNSREYDFDSVNDRWQLSSNSLSSCYDLGFSINTEYIFSNRFGLLLSYNHGFIDVLSVTYIDFDGFVFDILDLKNRLLKLEFRYYLME